MITSAEHKESALVRIARNMVGVNASNNDIINRMRKATDNKAEGEPWCVCFVQWAAREVDSLVIDLCGEIHSPRHTLPVTESTQALWKGAPTVMRSPIPLAGKVAVWRLDKDHAKGHCGIVLGVGGDNTVLTVEGNTGATSGATEAERNGNGVWMKRREGGAIPGFTLLGYLSPWG